MSNPDVFEDNSDPGTADRGTNASKTAGEKKASRADSAHIKRLKGLR